MKHIKFAIISLSLVSVLSACDKAASTKDSSKPLRVVDVVSPVEGPAQLDIRSSGSLAFREESKLGFKTGGVIGQVLVREGDVVKPGQLLATLEGAEIDAAVAQTQALHDKAVRDLQRGESLYLQEVVSKEVLDNLKTAETLAKASLAASQFNRGTARLQAGAAAVVVKRLAEAGEVIAPGQPVLLLGSLKSGLVFRSGLSDSQVVQLRKDANVSVVLDAYPDVSLPASILEIGQSADARTGAYRIEFKLADGAGQRALLAGMVGRAVIPVSGEKQRLSYLPLSTVVDTREGRVSVFMLEEGSVARKRELVVAFIGTDTVALKEALPADAQVVLSGAAFLKDGETVSVSRGKEKP
ncbi:MAG: efflux RND transporter periplasmic adaptor subunit [Burkholderiales bacterium]|nr:efflux RND transporter periplasmic adaptor subunit [Burkholderiales bacterium]